MSMLLLDIGNSRVKWTLLPALDAPLPSAKAIAHEGAPAAAIHALAAQVPASQCTAVFIAHVTGAAHEAAITQAVQTAFAVAPVFARSSAECAGLKNAYADPTRLGVDRWLAMLALWSSTHTAFCVASAGTALTFDAVDASGQHQGGVIAPGLAAMIDATLGHTRFAVGDIQLSYESGLGRDTEACVRQGALHASAGLLDRLASRHPGPPVLAGGDASVLAPLLTAPWQLQADLVLKGLAAWAGLASSG